MLFCILLFTCVSLFLILKRIKNPNVDYWRKRNIVQVDGTTKKFMFGDRSLAEIYKQIYDDHPTEPYVGIFVGSKPALLLRDLKNIATVLSEECESFFNRGILTNTEDQLTDNLFYADHYPRWKVYRQRWSPFYSSSYLIKKQFLIRKSAKDFVEMVADNKNVRENPYRSIFAYMAGAISTVVFGEEMYQKNALELPFLDMAWKMTCPSIKDHVMFYIANTFPNVYKYFKLKIFGDYEDFFLLACKSEFTRRRNLTKEEIKRRLIYDIIDVCLFYKDTLFVMQDPETIFELILTDDIMASQAFSFFQAGIETSANAMHFTLMELANNPEILKKVHEEVDEISTKYENVFHYEAVCELVYLDMVINETMRKYPPIGYVQRQCTKESVLPVGNLKIEKGQLIIVPVFGIHRDEKYYPDPEQFDPERFSAVNVWNRKDCSYLAFGAGYRECIGKDLGLLMVKTALAMLLLCFTLEDQSYTPEKFEPSTSSLRAPNAEYEIVSRSDECLLSPQEKSRENDELSKF